MPGITDEDSTDRVKRDCSRRQESAHHHRGIRQTLPEVILCQGKTKAQCVAIARAIFAKSGRLLGAHVVGASATELIAEPALTQLFQGDAWEMGRNIHPHPTLSEAVMEAALAVDGHAIHI